MSVTSCIVSWHYELRSCASRSYQVQYYLPDSFKSTKSLSLDKAGWEGPQRNYDSGGHEIIGLNHPCSHRSPIHRAQRLRAFSKPLGVIRLRPCVKHVSTLSQYIMLVSYVTLRSSQLRAGYGNNAAGSTAESIHGPDG